MKGSHKYTSNKQTQQRNGQSVLHWAVRDASLDLDSAFQQCWLLYLKTHQDFKAFP